MPQREEMICYDVRQPWEWKCESMSTKKTCVLGGARLKTDTRPRAESSPRVPHSTWQWGWARCPLPGKMKVLCTDLPGGAVVKNLPASSGDTASIPGPGRSHMPWSNYRVPQLLSLRSRARATTAEPARHNYWSPRSTTREATAMSSPCITTKSSPCSPELEKSPCAAMKTQRSQK